MTVPVPGSLTYTYLEDGVTTVFSYPVRFLEATELVVIREDADGQRSTLVYNTDYTVSGAGNPSGGSITRTAVTGGGKIILTRSTAPKQLVDLKDAQRNPAEAVELQLDRLAMSDQDMRETLKRTLKVGVGESGDDMELAPVATDGTYDSLFDKPTLGTAAATDATEYATAADGELARSAIQSLVAGQSTSIDSTDPQNPVIAFTGTGTGDVLAANNGSDFTSAPDVRKNIAVPVYVADRTAAKALDPTKDAVLTITGEGGRNGSFVWASGDQSALVTADPLEGVCFGPSSDPTGASGAWVRQEGFFVGAGVSATHFGAMTDGATDDAAPVQAAADFMSAFGGGRVRLPTGKIVLKDQIVLDKNVWLIGTGWSTYADDDAGTILVHDFSEMETPPDAAIKVIGAGGGLSNVEQRTAQPTPDTGWEPALQGTWAIKVYRQAYYPGARHFKIQNVMQRAWSRGVFVRSDQVEIEGLYGQWFDVGIEISGAYDVTRVNVMHHWAFWSSDANVVAYQEDHCRLIRSGRDDNPQFTSIFGWHVYAGIEFFSDADAEPKGRTERAAITNFGFDWCVYGILTGASDANSPGHKASLVNGHINCITTKDSIAIFARGNYDAITLDGVRITGCGRHVVHAIGSNAKVLYNSGVIDSWNQMNGGYAMMFGGAAAGNMVLLGEGVAYPTDGSASNNGPVTNDNVYGKLKGNVKAAKEITLTGTLDGSGNANVDFSAYTGALHTRLLALQGFANDSSNRPDQLDKTQIAVSSSTVVAITAGGDYANRAYRVYVKVMPSS